MTHISANMDVPYISRGMLEVQAGLLLHSYGQEKRKTVALPIPVDAILENFLRLKFSFMDMREVFGVEDVQGALWMESAEVGVDYNLDPDAHPRMEGRYNFTVAHEIGHWQLHRRYKLSRPAPMLPFGSGEIAAPTYVCRSNTRNRAEIQANLFASSLLMPKPMVVGSWRELYGDHPMTTDMLRQRGIALVDGDQWMRRIPTNEDEYIQWQLESVTRPLAARFRVSLQAMRIRLEELGFLIKNALALTL
jgi:hypothetical protein